MCTLDVVCFWTRFFLIIVAAWNLIVFSTSFLLYLTNRKEQLKTQLEEILTREGDEKSRAFATDLLSKYDYYLS